MAKLADLVRWTGARVGLDVTPRRGAGAEAGALAEARADEPHVIQRVASLADADAGSCVFATSAAALKEALESRAGAILVSASLEGSLAEAEQKAARDGRVLWVEDARYSFAVVAQHLRPESRAGAIASSAVVAPDARIGPRTVLEAGAVVGAGVHIGEDCRIGPRAVLLPGTRVGDRVVVQAGAVLGSDGFGYVRNAVTGEYLAFPQQGTLVIEDDVEIGANATIDRGALGETRIGRGSKIDNLVHIGHNCRIGQHVVIAAQTGIAGSSEIEDGAVLGGQVGIADHVTIGAGVILGAQAGVPSGKRLRGAGQVFWGTPARPIEQYLRDLAKLRRS